MTLDLAKLRAETLALIHGTTPGPWVARKDGMFWDIVDQSGRDIVTVYGGGVPAEHKDANARLIAAAPTLAADTLRLLDEIERLRSVLQDIVESWDWWTVDEYDRDRGGLADSIDAARAALAEGGKDG